MPSDALLTRTFDVAAAQTGLEWLSSMRDRSMTEIEIEHACLRSLSPMSTSVPRAIVLIRTSGTGALGNAKKAASKVRCTRRKAKCVQTLLLLG
jgi:hypothetical protein